MAEQSRRARIVDSLVLALLGAAYAVWAASFIARSSVETEQKRYFCLFDDAMVSLRYAWNLTHGDGLVWNPGERIEGSTSFLLTMLMAPGTLLFDKSAAALFTQIAGGALVLGTALFARKLSRLLGGAAGPGFVTALSVLAYYPLSYWSLMGMETGLLSLLATAALCLALGLGAEPKASPLLGVLVGLMFATRPDAVVPGVVILGFRGALVLHRERRLAALRPLAREVAPFLLIAGALTLFRLAYYGSPLPNTYDLKMAGWPLASRLANGWRFVGPFFETSRPLFLLALISVLLERDARRLLLLLFASSVVACQIWVGGDAWSPYWRMLVPGVVVLIALSVDGARALVARLLGLDKAPLTLGVCLLGATLVLSLANRPFAEELSLESPPYKVMLNRRMVKDGLELARYASSEASVAVMAAGTLPYYSGLRGVDVLGKSDRTIARIQKDPGNKTVIPGHNKYDLDHSIRTLRPDVIYDALRWARYHPDILEFVTENYVWGGSFRMLRGSPHVLWHRLPKQP